MPENPQNTPEISQNQVIKNLDSLFNTLKKDFPELAERFDILKQELKQKYIDKAKKLFTITKGELDELKQKISGNPQDLENIIKNQIDKEISEEENNESGLENFSLKSFNIDYLKNHVEDKRLKEIISEFDTQISNFLSQYKFLGTNEQNILKFSITNKLIDGVSSFGINPDKIIKEGVKLGEKIKEKAENPKDIKIKDFKDISSIFKKFSGEESKENKSETGLFDKIKIIKKLGQIQENFGKKLEAIQKIFKKEGIRDIQIQQNIISNIPIFHNPKVLENFDEKDVEKEIKEIIENDNEKMNFYNENLPEDSEELKKYLIDSREKLEDLDKKIKMSSQMQNMVMELVTSDPTGVMEGILKFLLKLPIIGKLLEKFLGVNLENLGENKKLFETFQILQSFGGNFDKNGNIINNEYSIISFGGEVYENNSILKDKNLTRLDFSRLKPFLEFVNKRTNTKKEKAGFISDIVSGKDLNFPGIKISVKLDNNDFSGDKKPKSSFYEKLNNLEKNIEEEKVKQEYQKKYGEKTTKQQQVFEKSDIKEQPKKDNIPQNPDFKTKKIFGENSEVKEEVSFSSSIIKTLEKIENGNLKEGIKIGNTEIKLEKNNILSLKVGDEVRKFEIKTSFGKLNIKDVIFKNTKFDIITDNSFANLALRNKDKPTFVGDIQELLQNGILNKNLYKIQIINS